MKTLDSSCNTSSSTFCDRSTETDAVTPPETKNIVTTDEVRRATSAATTTRTTGTNTYASTLVDKGVQCYGTIYRVATAVATASAAVQCSTTSLPPRPSVTKTTQTSASLVSLIPTPRRLSRSASTKSAQKSSDMKDRSSPNNNNNNNQPRSRSTSECSTKSSQTTTSLASLNYSRSRLRSLNKETQAQEQPKLKQHVATLARPSTKTTGTDARARKTSLDKNENSGKKSIGTMVAKDLIRCTSVGTQQQLVRTRDCGTSMQRKVMVDVSVGVSVAPSTNYCDECKQNGKNLREGDAKSKLIRQDTWTESLHLVGLDE